MPRVLVATLVALIIVIVTGPKFIAFLRRNEFGQQIREEGPRHHVVKQGTPVMGGLLIVLAALVAFLALSHHTWAAFTVLLVTLGCSAIGFTDDLIKTRQAIFQQPDWLQACEANMALQNPEIRRRNMLTDEALGRIQAPAMVLWTTKDPSGPVAEAQRITSLIPGARLAVMQNCGHWPQYEDTETFDQIHLDFLLDR